MNTDTWSTKYDTAAQDFLADERVIAAVQVARAGGWMTLALSQVNGLAGLWASRRQRQKAPGLPQMFLLAVTAEHLVALKLPTSSTGLKPRAVAELRRWPLDAIEVTTGPAIKGTKITIAGPGDERCELQGPEGELTERVTREVQARATMIAA